MKVVNLIHDLESELDNLNDKFGVRESEIEIVIKGSKFDIEKIKTKAVKEDNENLFKTVIYLINNKELQNG
jgi:hypothetical protein